MSDILGFTTETAVLDGLLKFLLLMVIQIQAEVLRHIELFLYQSYKGMELTLFHMSFNPDTTTVSEKAFIVAKAIAKKEDGSYGKEIAEEYDMNQPDVASLINNLQENGIVEKGKRTRAQYYEISKEGVYQCMLNEIYEEMAKDHFMEQVPKMFGEEGEPYEMPESLTESLNTLFEDEEIVERIEERMPDLCYRWLIARLKEGKATTLREVFVDEFYDSLRRTEDLPQWLERFFTVFDSYYDADELPEDTLENILAGSESEKNRAEKHSKAKQ